MEKIEIILTECIKEIKSGKATLADCLNRYPSRRKELEPLLKTALNIQEPPVFNLDNNYKQAAKAQLLHQIRTTRQKKARSLKEIFTYGIPPQYAWARIALSVFIVVILLSTLGGGTAFAAQSSLPGDLLYPVKTGTEDARLLIAGDSIAKVDLNLEFAQNRLEELSELVNSDEGKAGLAVKGYQRNLEAARQQVLKISDIASLSGTLEKTLLNIQNQTAFCDEILDANPEYSGLVNTAGTLAVDEQIMLTEILAEQNNLQAVQINLNAMQNRLQRAQDKAGVNQYQLMQEALLQYQQFNQLGELLLQRSQTTGNHNTEVEALVLQALAGSLDALDNIYQQSPQEYRNTIDASRQMTLQFQNQARHMHQQQGNSDMNPEGSPSGNGNSPETEQDNQSAPQSQGGTETGNQEPDAVFPAGTEVTLSGGEGTGTGSGTNPGEPDGKGSTTPGPGTPQTSVSPPKSN